ncbi:MAG: hypothetical protein NXI00_24130 [Cytophagales bacterium]|nr:hypothetical protein [Cytophagales bacterium]
MYLHLGERFRFVLSASHIAKDLDALHEAAPTYIPVPKTSTEEQAANFQVRAFSVSDLLVYPVLPSGHQPLANFE